VTFVFSAMLAILRNLKTGLNGLLVLGRMIVELATHGAFKLDEIIL
jgi:hypothetical protein